MRQLIKILTVFLLTYGAVSTAQAVTSDIAMGQYYTCALTSAGGVQCWGKNDMGQLGDNTRVNKLTPVAVSGLSSDVAAVTAGHYHACALTSTAGVKCWGNNGYGQLGDNTTVQKLTPVAVSGLSGGVVAVTAGAAHTCALTSAGGVQCWGDNYHGQLGDNTTVNKLTPVAVSGLSSGVAAVSAGDYHTCALTSAGGVQCWGKNSNGQLGDNTTVQKLTPVAVSGLSSGVVAVTAGTQHTCAITSAGGVQCWGYNINGQLGDNTYMQKLTPVAVSGLSSGVVAITAGYGHTCALTSAGGVQCWGKNSNGELGDNTTWTRPTPVAVSGLSSGVLAVTAGYSHTCAIAIASAGGVQCWGGNNYGGLGDNTTVKKLTPVWVVGFDDSDGDSVVGAADALPTNAAASIDTDHDGMPDSWNAACDATCQNSSGLVLDNDNDDDGIPNAIDPTVLWTPLTVNGGYKGSTISDTQNVQ